ncbi:hypothetical protein Hdeb2414_s0008g00293281 [Helianthus debilis subsp. tardiflorus]
MNTRFSPAKSPIEDEGLRSHNLLKNPSSEICKFTDPEILNLVSCFPPGIVFRPFDPSACSDATSKTWFCFLALLFLLGYSYPFPDLTQRFFTLTVMSYSQAMPMLWRTLFTIEEILEKERLEFGLLDLTYLYSLVTYGSNRFLFKYKPHQLIPIHKTTQNDSTWKNQFFFVRRDSIPDGDTMPLR